MEGSDNLSNEIKSDCSFHERSPRIFNYVPAVIHEAMKGTAGYVG